MHTSTLTSLLLAIVALVSCDASEDDIADRSGRSPPRYGELRVFEGRIQGAYATGTEVIGLGGAPVSTPGEVNPSLFGILAPAAVPDGAPPRVLAYNSFEGGVPVIRLRDVETGDEQVLDRGAYSVAWRDDGALAYFKGLKDRVADPEKHLGHLLVRASAESPAEAWTTRPARYTAAAWAGESLIAHRSRGATTDVLALEGPGVVRVLAEDAALVALSPDGAEALVTDQVTTPSVRLLRVEDGKEVAAFTFPASPGSDHVIQYVAHSGSWGGEVAVAAVTEGLAVFEVGEDSLALQQVLHLDPEQFPLGLMEPQLDASGRVILASVELAPTPGAAVPLTAMLECDRIALRCATTEPLPYFPPARAVYNPSRP